MHSPEPDEEKVLDEYEMEDVQKEDQSDNEIPLAYKTDAVRFWRICKTKERRSLKRMQHMYKKITSISQLER